MPSAFKGSMSCVRYDIRSFTILERSGMVSGSGVPFLKFTEQSFESEASFFNSKCRSLGGFTFYPGMGSISSVLSVHLSVCPFVHKVIILPINGFP